MYDLSEKANIVSSLSKDKAEANQRFLICVHGLLESEPLFQLCRRLICGCFVPQKYHSSFYDCSMWMSDNPPNNEFNPPENTKINRQQSQ